MKLQSELKQRRANVFAAMPDNSAAFVYCGQTRLSGNSDEELPFYPNSNFFYLTGLNQTNSILLMIKKDGKSHEYLFIDEKDPHKEKWTGLLLSMEEAKEVSGIKNVLLLSTYELQVQKLVDDQKVTTIYLDLAKEVKISERTSTLDEKIIIEETREGLEVRDLNRILVPLRSIKSAYEVEQLKEAIKLTRRGIEAVRNSLQPGLYEYQMAALFEYVIKDTVNTTLAFPTIVGAGQNGVILHYPQAQKKIKEDELVLFDLGAKFNGYCADISRTYPASGKFSPIQKTIYQIVLGCNKHIIQIIKPGLSLTDLQNAARIYLKEECVKAGLLKEEDPIMSVYYHGVSHHLGLDTHDLSTYIDREAPLVAGNVITVEPGLYFKEHGIGIRIEDDVYVSEDGAVVLSKDIQKEVREIER